MTEEETFSKPQRVSFVTCVRDWTKYANCKASIEALEPDDFEVDTVTLDNGDGKYSSPQALNLGWEKASGELIVFCHEDVTYPSVWLKSLRATLGAVAGLTPPWAVVGPMGRARKRFLGHAEDGAGEPSFFGPLPALVDTVDEFCLVVPADLPLRFDEALGDHHLYGVDLCIQATEAGYGCYAADLPCRHDSATRHRPPEYHAVKRRLQRKWMFRRRKVGRVIGTTCGQIRFGIFEGWI